MTDDSDQPPCHNLTVRECKIVHNIDKIIPKYDQLNDLIRQLQNIVNNNDWYFIIHRQQIMDDDKEGKRQRESYVETLLGDTERHLREIDLIKSLLNRAISTSPIRDIKYESDSRSGDKDGETPIN